MRLALIVLLVCISSQSYAAEFIDVTDAVGLQWIYRFSLKSGPMSVSTPTTIFRRHCGDRSAAPPGIKNDECFAEEGTARASAQKMADNQERDIIARGESTTKIEAHRMLHAAKRAIPGN